MRDTPVISTASKGPDLPYCFWKSFLKEGNVLFESACRADPGCAVNCTSFCALSQKCDFAIGECALRWGKTTQHETEKQPVDQNAEVCKLLLIKKNYSGEKRRVGATPLYTSYHATTRMAGHLKPGHLTTRFGQQGMV